jgi:hypothetical protein
MNREGRKSVWQRAAKELREGRSEGPQWLTLSLLPIGVLLLWFIWPVGVVFIILGGEEIMRIYDRQKDK